MILSFKRKIRSTFKTFFNTIGCTDILLNDLEEQGIKVVSTALHWAVIIQNDDLFSKCLEIYQKSLQTLDSVKKQNLDIVEDLTQKQACLKESNPVQEAELIKLRQELKELKEQELDIVEVLKYLKQNYPYLKEPTQVQKAELIKLVQKLDALEEQKLIVEALKYLKQNYLCLNKLNPVQEAEPIKLAQKWIHQNSLVDEHLEIHSREYDSNSIILEQQINAGTKTILQANAIPTASALMNSQRLSTQSEKEASRFPQPSKIEIHKKNIEAIDNLKWN